MSMLLLLRRRSLHWRPLVAHAASTSSTPPPTSSASSSQPSPALRSLPGARELLQTLERAPCLSCGAAPAAHRVTCRITELPLACSEADVREAARERARRAAGPAPQPRERHGVRRQPRRAATLLRRRLSVGGFSFKALSTAGEKPTAWTDYLSMYAPPAGPTAVEDARLLSDERAVRLASSAFSYVLTLSAFLSHLLPPAKANDGAVALHVVGARAEAMMPDYLWDEVALLHPPRTSLNITLVGDHVPIARSIRSARGLPLQVEAVRGLYHDVALPPPDALVLFNPGVGHPLLRDRWRPTVRAMLESGKPLLLTAFSAADQERDVAVLRKLAEGSASGRRLRFLVEPNVNPFRSLKYQVNDDGGSVALIQTNSHVMAVQLAY